MAQLNVKTVDETLQAIDEAILCSVNHKLKCLNIDRKGNNLECSAPAIIVLGDVGSSYKCIAHINTNSAYNPSGAYSLGCDGKRKEKLDLIYDSEFRRKFNEKYPVFEPVHQLEEKHKRVLEESHRQLIENKRRLDLEYDAHIKSLLVEREQLIRSFFVPKVALASEAKKLKYLKYKLKYLQLKY